MRGKAPRISFFVISLLLALADQGIKRLVDASLSLGESRVIIPGFLNLTYLKNPGGAFSLLAGLPPVWGRAFFIVATLAALVFVYYLYHHNPPESRWGRTGLVLIFGGGLGNLVDRLSTGEVIDFILFYFRGYYWPAFNLADSCITIGVALMAVDVVSGAMRRETPPPEDPDPESADS